MIKAVLFDFDGTVADTNNLILNSFKHVFETYRINDVSDETIYSFFGEPLTITLGRYADADSVGEMISCYRNHNLSKHDEMIGIFPGVKETLEYLNKNQITCGVVTSKLLPTVMKGMDAIGLRNYFQLLVTPEDTVKHKPDKEPVMFALKKLGYACDEVLMVGDSPYDIESGNSAGCRTVAVMYSKISKDILDASKPTFKVDKFEDIITIIEKINAIEK